MECKTCNLTFKNKDNYTKHLKTQRHQKRLANESTVHSCVCGKSYSYHQSLYVHRKTCEQYKQAKNNPVLNKMQKEMDELKKQINILLDKQADNHNTTNNNTTNIDTQNNTINININSFGNENLDYIDDEIICKCINRVFKSVPCLLEKIHFDPLHPENHNIKITNRKLPYATVLGNNKKWKTVNRKDAIDKMVNNGYFMLDEKYENCKDKFDPNTQHYFENFQSKFECEDKNTMKTLRNDVEMMVLNGGT
jgi:uncharacterized C2H2 Zn-finger protein